MIHYIGDDYLRVLETQIRDKNTNKKELRNSLYLFGYNLGVKICAENFLISTNVFTPMEHTYQGTKIDNSYNNIIVSTKDDYSYFAAGISKAIGCTYTGYIDFNGARGESTYTEPIRSIELPDILNGKPVKSIIIAKSVIATGCTAISLAKKALEKYVPKSLIIVSAFYSQTGIEELNFELPNADIYVGTAPDSIDQDGMLLPGVGNIDIRIK